MPLIVAVVLVVAITTLFTLFIRAKDIPPPDPVSPTQHLEDRKAQIYENLRDLQFEYRVGKLSDADYQQTKLTLQKELAIVLAEIDRIAGPQKVAPAPAKVKSEPAPANVCPHCGAKFPNSMKFCGECGKAMS
jgi:hypothetical protein